MDAFLPSMLAALAGATAGSAGTAWVQWARDARRDIRSDTPSLREKVHQLEIRIVKLEAENRAFIVAGSRTTPAPEGTDA